jgi:hypothetical protein
MSAWGLSRPNWTVRASFLPLATELRTLLDVRFVPHNRTHAAQQKNSYWIIASPSGLQTLLERGDSILRLRIIRRQPCQDPDSPLPLALLRAHREWPRRC